MIGGDSTWEITHGERVFERLHFETSSVECTAPSISRSLFIGTCSGCLYLGVTIRESLFQALIDCGACVNLLSYKSAKRLGICEHLRASNVTLAGVSGAKVQTLGSVSLMVGKGDELPITPAINRRQWVRKDPGAR